ncbi:phosphate transport system substrate-binding protein [Methanohalophilus levihalophilus]|uniref:PstS family phosphate ABC transporter substrate-binding protein n=1 Tax=Methanohalophilus levihalophilus TaxID=1431282 RepID=UPI001AEA4579|nr:PstS family phosphate ABC transporter substrate-binding protein [Methanohalophilus levihalophilus]MBP2029334.1 phosphate transport system substrate-binding protein [Methanohalophilus levihalophilus]
MINRAKLWTITLVLIMVVALFGAGCTGNENGEDEVEMESIIVKGSDTVLPLSQAEAEIYMENNPETSITVIGGGSGVGIAALIDGEIEIAMASRSIKESERETAETNGINPMEHVVAWDGIAVVVNPENTIEGLTYEQIRGIYNGTYSNWADVGGNDMEIVVTSRDSSSGTYEYFKEEAMSEDEYRADKLTQPSNGAIVQTVSQNEYAIGYIGFAYLDDSIKPISLDAGEGMIEATEANILGGEYPLARPLYLYTNGEPEGLAADFINFIQSDEGKAIVTDVGYFPA